MGVSQTNECIQIKIKMPNYIEKLPDLPKASNQDLKIMDFSCTFIIKLENQQSECGCIKNQWLYSDSNAKPQSGTSSILQSSNQDLREIYILCNFIIIKIDSQNSENWCIKNQWPYSNKDWYAKPLSGTSSIFQSPL